MLRVATVFSGIGSPEWALKRLKQNVYHTFACDIDKFAKKSYFANYDIDESRWFDDITTLDGSKFVNQVDLFLGGSPCQAFSTFGNLKGFDDTRGTLFFHYARLIREIQPRVFIFENVENLTRHDKGNTWKVIRKVFDDLGYNYKFQVLNAKDYGIPQSRSRVFVVGFRSDLQPSWDAFEFPGKIPLVHFAKEFLQDRGTTPAVISRGFTEQGPVDKKYTFSAKMEAWIMTTGTKGFHCTPGLDRDLCKTLLASSYKMHRSGIDNYYTNPDGSVRRMTPRENLRLMGYDDSFKIDVSDMQMIKQAGNSIVVDVIEAILKNVLAVLPDDYGNYIPLDVKFDPGTAIRVQLEPECELLDDDLVPVDEIQDEVQEAVVQDEVPEYNPGWYVSKRTIEVQDEVVQDDVQVEIPGDAASFELTTWLETTRKSIQAQLPQSDVTLMLTNIDITLDGIETSIHLSIKPGKLYG